MAQNYYDLLGVSRDATLDEIKKAYKKAALQHHPDKGGDSEKFKECGAAVETLSDVNKRAAYDSQLARTRCRDGLRGSFSANVPSAPRAASQPAKAQAPAASATTSAYNKPPRPPPGAAMEIPADPSLLSAKDLKELLTQLGIDHEGCYEKADFVELLKKFKEQGKRSGPDTPRHSSKESAARGGAQQTAAPSAAPSSFSGPVPPKGHPQRIKILSLGAAGVGKSCLIKRYCEGRFVQKYITTIGIDYGVKPVKVLGQDVKVNFFDSSGGEEFKDIRQEFYDNASGVLLIYDMNQRSTFVELDDWLEEAARHKCPLSKLRSSAVIPFVILCANKADLGRREVTKSEGSQFASNHGMTYFETSACSGENITEALTFMFEKIVGFNLDARKRLGAG